jgi:hypothetical protein
MHYYPCRRIVISVVSSPVGGEQECDQADQGAPLVGSSPDRGCVICEEVLALAGPGWQLERNSVGNTPHAGRVESSVPALALGRLQAVLCGLHIREKGW